MYHLRGVNDIMISYLLSFYCQWKTVLYFCIHFQEPEEKPLTKEIVADSLSLLCKTGGGLAHAYVKLDVHDK